MKVEGWLFLGCGIFFGGTDLVYWRRGPSEDSTFTIYTSKNYRLELYLEVRRRWQMASTYEGATEQAREIVHHHAVLPRGLERRAGTICAAVENGVPYEQPLATLREYLEGEILPHAEAEERTLYRAAVTQARGSELVRALTAEHRELAYLAGRLQRPADGPTAATVAEWITTLFAGHVAKENDLLLPALTGSGADLAALLADMHHTHAGAQA
jgi:hypothetical protein